jgi:Superinfection immunity protein
MGYNRERESPMGDGIAGLIALSIGLLLYLIPTLVAYSCSHHQATAIFALNLLLGWTVLGWMISLVWGLTATRGANAQ